MVDLYELKEKVAELEKTAKLDGNHKEKQIKILQEISAKLINEYEIKIGNLTIEPLLVEAYYYHEEKFPDNAVHAAKRSGKIAEQAHRRQQKNFGKLYVHCPKGDGIDICMTDSDEYYLSFLIKNALVENQWKTQFSIADELCRKCNQCNEVSDCIYNDEIVLHKKDSSKNNKIVYLPRKGIFGDFACAPLAAFPLDNILDYNFTLPNGYKEQWKRAVYALEHENMNEEKALKLVKNKWGSRIEEKYWLLAKETLQNHKKDMK